MANKWGQQKGSGVWCLAAISFSGADVNHQHSNGGGKGAAPFSHRPAACVWILPTASAVWNSFALSYVLSACFSYSTFPQAHSTDDVLVQYISITHLVLSLGPNCPLGSLRACTKPCHCSLVWKTKPLKNITPGAAGHYQGAIVILQGWQLLAVSLKFVNKVLWKYLCACEFSRISFDHTLV